MTKILITGASGMVGKHLVDMCLDKGYYVRGTDIRLDDRYLEENIGEITLISFKQTYEILIDVKFWLMTLM